MIKLITKALPRRTLAELHDLARQLGALSPEEYTKRVLQRRAWGLEPDDT